jgi:hypothetical protein
MRGMRFIANTKIVRIISSLFSSRILPSKSLSRLSWAPFALYFWSSPDFPVRPEVHSLLMTRHYRLFLLGHVRSHLPCQLWGVPWNHVLYPIQSQRIECKFYVHRQFIVYKYGGVLSYASLSKISVISATMPGFLKGLNYISILKWGTG